MKRLLIIPFLLFASTLLAQQTAFTICITDGETGYPRGGVEVALRLDGVLLEKSYTDANGCYFTDWYPVDPPSELEVDVTSGSTLPWYGYPEWDCEVLYPVSPPYIGCSGSIRLVPRDSMKTSVRKEPVK